ncbi:MAG: 4-hydroxy-3-methylbut-2-enyl diphosphate reductase [Chloroflexi bacterium]|nr:4-hydroxy-3-methylbut-2-enyl diphosphate reductase [Chloroflexota bacterium]
MAIGTKGEKSMEVILAAPRGFCAGVVRAIDIVELCLERFGKPVYVRHEIVHNPYVVADLRQKGAVFVNELDEVPERQVAIFAAHGVSPEVRTMARERRLRIIDATCPLVTKVHLEAIRYAREGFSIILVGHKDHDEVIGTSGEVPEKTLIAETVEDALAVQVQDPSRVVALTQTTLSVDDTKEIISALKRRFPNLVTRNDICYATTNRQMAVKALAKRVNRVLVIGAQNSSNCNRLREVAEAEGVPAYLVNGPDEVRPHMIDGSHVVGLISGASTPEGLVAAVIDLLKPEKVSVIEVVDENVSFVLPRELQETSPRQTH